VGFSGGAPVEKGGGIRQFLVGGEGVGRRGDIGVMEQARPGSARRRGGGG
jgi:hypothetical protein